MCPIEIQNDQFGNRVSTNSNEFNDCDELGLQLGPFMLIFPISRSNSI